MLKCGHLKKKTQKCTAMSSENWKRRSKYPVQLRKKKKKDIQNVITYIGIS